MGFKWTSREARVVFVSVALALCAYVGLSSEEVGDRTILTFLTPQGWSPDTTRDEEQKELVGWLAPAEAGRLNLLTAELPESISTYLRTQHSSQQTLRADPYALIEEGRLQVKVQTPFILEILVLEPDLKLAQAYSLAAVAHLQSSLNRLRETMKTNTRLDSEATQAKDQVNQTEGKLGRLLWTNDGPDLQRYSLNHYQESIRQYRLASTRKENWAESVDANCPEFTVISGPTPFHRPKRLSRPVAATVALVILVTLLAAPHRGLRLA